MILLLNHLQRKRAADTTATEKISEVAANVSCPATEEFYSAREKPSKISKSPQEQKGESEFERYSHECTIKGLTTGRGRR
jgi:hypothetical protein